MARNENTDMVRTPIELAKIMFGNQQSYVSRHVQPQQQQQRQMLIGDVPAMPAIESLINEMEMNNWEPLDNNPLMRGG
jgi:hypothetical protein